MLRSCSSPKNGKSRGALGAWKFLQFLWGGRVRVWDRMQKLFYHSPSSSQPPMVECKMEAQSEYVHIPCTYFRTFGADLYAQSVIINKISASELSQKFIKSALLVGLPLPPPPIFLRAPWACTVEKKKICGGGRKMVRKKCHSPLFLLQGNLVAQGGEGRSEKRQIYRKIEKGVFSSSISPCWKSHGAINSFTILTHQNLVVPKFSCSKI